MADRMYRLTFPSGRPVFFEDFGSLINLSGAVWQGEGGVTIITMFPNAVPAEMPEPLWLNGEDVNHILQATDNPVIYELDETGAIKAFHRKSEYAISGFVQQKIWVRDQLTCMYCGKKMGHVQLTIDHFIPLQLGGVNNETNYLAACRRCQKLKGAIHPEKYCQDNGLDYKGLCQYLEGKLPMAFIAHLRNPS